MGGGWWGRFNAKKQFLRQLHARAGYPWPLTLDSGFSFHVDDNGWDNIDQLEAIVEFYVNFPDPWDPANAPLQPGDAGYTTVNLRPPKGDDAHTDGADSWYKLDGAADLSLVRPNPPPGNAAGQNPPEGGFPAGAAGYPPPSRYLYSTIEFAADTSARLSKRYRITAVEANQRRVQIALDGAPTPPIFKDNATSSKWKIHNPATLVLIDPVGIRRYLNVANVDGSHATVKLPLRAVPGDSRQVLTLDAAAHHLDRINQRMDTIYLDSDTNTNHKPFRAYRIVDPDGPAAANEVWIDGTPTLSGGESRWHMPAGLSADGLPDPAVNYNLTAAAHPPMGFDHYDGLMFLVHEGAVLNSYRWSSYTSRQHGLGDSGTTGFHDAAGTGWDQQLSSIKGNRAYVYKSFASGGRFKNWCFAIRDLVPGNAGLVHHGLDRCEEAKYFFGEPQANGTLNAVISRDTVSPAPPAGVPGKTEIRIHRGNVGGSGSGSSGCIVSPLHLDLRTEMIAAYQVDFTAYYGAAGGDPTLAGVCRTPVCEGLLPPDPPGHPGWRTPAISRDWDDKLVGTLWLIRPDEPI